MNFRPLRFSRAGWLLMMGVLALTATGIVLAAPPSNLSFQPTSVSNAAASAILVTGAGIEANAQVVLDGFGALQTTDVTTGTLNANIPVGIPPGNYTVRVVNPNGESATAATPLTVTGATATPLATNTPAPTAFIRPQLIVISYGASSPTVAGGADYDFEMTFQNAGGETATNIVADFTEGDFLPRVTGGIRAVGNLAPGQTARIFQPIYAVREVNQKKVASLEVKVSYTTASGQSYTDSFTLTFPVVQASGPARPTTTPTSKPVLRPQMIIGAYRTAPEKLEPGRQFELELDIQNVGNVTAKRLTLVVGGGTAGDLGSGTPGPGGGVAGGGGSFTDFAPVGASNVQSLGDLDPARTVTASQKLIVNASTKAGAYPLKLSLVYVDDTGRTLVDDQVITVLVYQTPQLELSFYRDVGPIFAGQPNQLPIQAVNLGRSTALLGNMKVTAEGAQLTNNVLLIGPLDPGASFPLDATLIPEAAGPLELTVTVDYTDDFNQPQKITASLTVNVEENAPPPVDPGGPIPGEPILLTPESAGDMFFRFLRGFFGFGSDRPQPAGIPIDFGPGAPLPGPVEVRPGG
jgi:hypothetical protein